jgi:hypothetical protein
MKRCSYCGDTPARSAIEFNLKNQRGIEGQKQRFEKKKNDLTG